MVTIVQAKPQYLSNIYAMILTLAKQDGWDVYKCDQAGIDSLLSTGN